jgi:triose/dihydroxyacetone kinase / FAD-AMP lyase (cyclizing)
MSCSHCELVASRSASVLVDFLLLTEAHSQGSQQITPFPSVEGLIDHCLKLLCDPNDTERAFVAFNKDDKVVLLVNNYGGLSQLELGALLQEVLKQLGKLD